MSATLTESNKFIIGIYDHEEKLLKAIKHLRSKGIEIHDALSPFPIHGIDPIIGLKDTRLHTAGFFFGMTGMLTGLSVITFISK